MSLDSNTNHKFKKIFRNLNLAISLVLFLFIITLIYIIFDLSISKHTDSMFKPILDEEVYKESEKEGWHIIDAGPFRLEAPEDYKLFKGIRPFDSYVGGIGNKVDTLIFDYGWYSNDLSGTSRAKHTFARPIINGKNALIIKPRDPGNGTTAIYIEKVRGDNRFNLIGRDIIDEESTLTIFKSVMFDNSNPNENTEVLFSSAVSPRSGIHIYQNECAACHSLDSENTYGPALKKINPETIHYWINGTSDLSDIKETELGIHTHRSMYGSTLSESEVDQLIVFRESL